MLSGVDPPNEAGIVTRVDARSVLVKLDSGRWLLTEPELLTANRLTL